MKVLSNYSHIKGFNHEPDFDCYTHEQASREMLYAQRLGLNSCRLFMPLHFWRNNRGNFLSHLQDFIRTAWEHGISTTPILMMPYFTDGQTEYWINDDSQPEIPGCYFKENYHIGEDFVTDVVNLLKDEPGLLFWDVMNEPSWHGFIINVTDPQEKQRRLDMVWAFLHHFVKLTRDLDPVNALGIGHTFIKDTELSNTGDMVDIIIFHNYAETRSRVEDTCKRALELSEKYGKPVIDNETGCLCRANPYDVAIEIHDRHNIGWYIFKLMIEGGWASAHGICYPDGTVRDPSIVAAIRGFFRNRSETAVYPDINMERHAEKAIAFAKDALNRRASAEELLEAAEYIANMLECGELVPMAFPPTAQINAYRRAEAPNIVEIRMFLYTMVKKLKDVCGIVS